VLTTRLIAGAFVLAAGCGHVTAHVPHPLDNQVRYLCGNLHYDKPEITGMNYLRGKVIPFGTRVQIRQVDAVDKIRRMMEEGDVTVGMTRDQVLTAIGYPPAHRTPHLDAAMWTYWVDPEDTFEVYFEGDRVSRVQRREQGPGRGRHRRGG
jgi:hypothetical protein